MIVLKLVLNILSGFRLFKLAFLGRLLFILFIYVVFDRIRQNFWLSRLLIFIIWMFGMLF